MSDNTDLTSLTETDLANLCVICGKLPDDAVEPPCTCDADFEDKWGFSRYDDDPLEDLPLTSAEQELAERIGLEADEFVRLRLMYPGTVSDLYSTLDQLRLHVDNCGPSGHPICCCGNETNRGRLFFTCPCCREQYHKDTGINREVVA